MPVLASFLRVVVTALLLCLPLAAAAQTYWHYDRMAVPIGPIDVIPEPGTALPAGGAALDAFTDFAARRVHVGAFATAPSGAYGKAEGHMRVSSARAAALRSCRQHARDCRVVAVLAPRGLPDFDPLVASPAVMAALEDLNTRPTHRAIAVAANGVWGMVWDKPTQRAANLQSVIRCRAEIDGPTPIADGCRVVIPVLWRPRPAPRPQDAAYRP